MTRVSLRAIRLAIAAAVTLLALLAARMARGDISSAWVLLYAPPWRRWTILPAVLVELPVLWRWFGMSWRRAIVADLLMNAVTTLVGFLFVVPVEFASHFDLPAIVPRGFFEGGQTPPLIVLINTLVEYGVLRIAFRSRWTWTRAVMLYLANFAAFAILILGPPFGDTFFWSLVAGGTAGLVVELLVLRHWFDMPWGRAIVADLVMNAVPMTLGALLLAATEQFPSVDRLLVAWAGQLAAITPRWFYAGVQTRPFLVLIITLMEYGVLHLAFGSRWTWARAVMLYLANLMALAILILGLFLGLRPLGGP